MYIFLFINNFKLYKKYRYKKKNIMSILHSNEGFNLLKFLEQKIMFNHYSLNSCNSEINVIFYFRVASYVFVLLFSFIVTLLGIMWGRSKEDIFLLFQFNVYKNVINHYLELGFPTGTRGIKKYSAKLVSLYTEMYGHDLREDFELDECCIFWWEPWSYEIPAIFPPFESKFFNSPWHFYYKYRLSSWIRWHILEDRICIFVLFFLWILI